MFTGLVQFVGSVISVQEAKLRLEMAENATDPWQIGESIAVNGCCLTLVDAKDGLSFDLSQETTSRTTIGEFKPGEKVNIERAMKASDRFGGHIVQGHVDGVGQILSIEELEASRLFSFDVGEQGRRFLIDKGSVCVDGISLTVIKPQGGQFLVSVVPHTSEQTTLKWAEAGNRVNIEFDILAKHVANLIEPYDRRKGDRII